MQREECMRKFLANVNGCEEVSTVAFKNCRYFSVIVYMKCYGLILKVLKSAVYCKNQLASLLIVFSSNHSPRRIILMRCKQSLRAFDSWFCHCWKEPCMYCQC